MWGRVARCWVLGATGCAALAIFQGAQRRYETVILCYPIAFEQPDGWYSYSVCDPDVDRIPEWLGPGRGRPPLSSDEAIRLSRRELWLRAPSNLVEWSVVEFRAEEIKATRWMYVVTWEAPRPGDAGTWSVSVPVLLSGEVVPGIRREDVLSSVRCPVLLADPRGTVRGGEAGELDVRRPGCQIEAPWPMRTRRPRQRSGSSPKCSGTRSPS